MRPPEELLRTLRAQERFVLATHENPEGDALGSTLALAEALRARGKQVMMFLAEPVPELYHFLPGWAGFSQVLPPDVSAWVLVLLDCGAPGRAGLKGASEFRCSVVIDHHATEQSFGDVRWVEPQAPATGLMVYELLKALGHRPSPQAAQCLYTAVAIDTGIFRYGNTTAEVLRAAAELVELGARPAEVAQSLYESWPERKLRLLARALASLELRDDLAVLTVTQEDLKSTGTTLQDVENFTAFARMLKAAQRVALLVELEGGVVKASLRSRADGDVKTVAEAFGGGGHRSAAGFKMRGSLSEVKRALLERMLRPASP